MKSSEKTSFDDADELKQSAMKEIEAGNWKNADELLQRAVAAVETDNADSEDLSRLLSISAAVAANQNDLPRAIAFSRRALIELEKRNTVDASLIHELNNLGTFLRLHNQHTDATPFVERSVALQKQFAGADDEMTVRMSIYLAQHLVEIQQFDKAQTAIREVLDTCHRKQYINHEVEAIELITDALQRCNKYDVMEQLCYDEINALGDIYGLEHPALSIPIAALGKCYLATGRFEDAHKNLIIAYNMRSQLLGPEHPLTAKAAQLLGIFMMGVGETDNAVQFFEEALTIARQNRDIGLVVRVLGNYSSCLRHAGREQEAQHLESEANRILSETGM